MKVCNDFYKVTVGGVVTVVHHRYTRITSSYSYIDGTPVDEDTLAAIEDQLVDGNLINEGIAFNETLDKVEWVKAPTEQLPDRKIIVLKQGDMIVGEDTDGHQYNLAMLSRFGVMDYGSSAMPMNFTASGRPTVQLPGESGEEAHEVAFVGDDMSSAYMDRMIGIIPLDGIPEKAVPQILPALERSYVDDLGDPDMIDGKPFGDDNGYTIGDPYIVFAWFDEGLVMHYVMFSTDFPGIGYLTRSILSALNTLNDKIPAVNP